MTEPEQLPEARIAYRLVPAIVLGVAGFAFTALATWPGNRTEAMWMVTAQICTVLIAFFLLFGWAMFLSGMRKIRVLITFLMILCLGLSTVNVRCDGDMVPIVTLKDWPLRLVGRSHFDQLAQQWKSEMQAGMAIPALIAQEEDFPAYRGWNRDGVVPGSATLLRDWTATPPRLVWKHLIGEGYAGFSVVQGYLFTIEQFQEHEAVLALDATTGTVVWRREWPNRFDEKMGGPGPRATPTFHEGKIYALGAKGRLVCLSATDGSELWAKEILEENENLYWGMCGSPLIVGDLVIVSPGEQTHQNQPEIARQKSRAMMAFHRLTGDLVWKSGSSPAGYSSPMLATLGGHPQILIFDGTGLGSYDPADGKELWRFPWRTQQNIHVAQPLVLDDSTVYISSGYGVGGAAIDIRRTDDKWSGKLKWRGERESMRCKFTSPVFHQGYIYGLNDGILECISAEDGTPQWKDGRKSAKGAAYGHGQILLAGDLIIALTEFGEIALVEATPKEFREKGRVHALGGQKTWNTPAMRDGRLFIRNDREMACYDLRPE